MKRKSAPVRKCGEKARTDGGHCGDWDFGGYRHSDVFGLHIQVTSNFCICRTGFRENGGRIVCARNRRSSGVQYRNQQYRYPNDNAQHNCRVAVKDGVINVTTSATDSSKVPLTIIDTPSLPVGASTMNWINSGTTCLAANASRAFGPGKGDCP